MVLDPASALGIAGNVLQFIDFANSLSKLSGALQNSIRSESTSIGRTSQYTLAEKGLWEANKQCYRLSVDLVDALETLKVTDRHRKWQSLWQALRSTWSEEQIRTLSHRLSRAREQLMTHLLVHISSTQRFDYDSLITQSNAVQRNILEAIQQSSRGLKKEVKSLSRTLESAKAEDHAHILVDWQALNRKYLKELSGDLHEVTENAHLRDVEDQLLNSLYFTRLEERRDRIAEAHKQTFKWIFGGVREDGTRCDKFALWLKGHRALKGVFWVSGKAGSGKSTLMRYLDDNERTKSCLRKWADNKQLIIASCFFWKAGTPIQKSLTGMLRSLLHQILLQKKGLIPDINPWRWRSLYWCSSALDDWTDAELIKAMQKFVRISRPAVRLALFIDGLDEFDGDDAQMEYLIDFFQNLAKSSDVKICLSSRPWNIFHDAFADCPKLRLELLTQGDIERYVQDKLDQSLRFRQLYNINKSGCLGLVTEIVQKATGVFLWVSLVVRELVEGLRDGHDLRMLRKRLDQLPADLDDFFLQMLNTIESSDRPAASRMFQIVLGGGMRTLMTLAFVEEDNVDFSLEDVGIESTLASITDKNESMVRRINHLCMGLLEVRKPPTDPASFDLNTTTDDELSSIWNWEVDYLHRTVNDFLLVQKCQNFLLSYTNGDYDINRYMCNALLAQMILVSGLDDSSRPIGRFVATPQSSLFLNFFEVLIKTVEVMEAQSSPPAALLSRLQQVFVDYVTTIEGRFLLPADRLRSRAWESMNRWEDWDCSFLTLSLQYNVVGIYFASPRSALFHPNAVRRGRPILDFALRRWASKPRSPLPPKPRLIEILLADGADPNEVFELGTIWERFVAYMATQLGQGSGTRINKGRESLLAVTETDTSAWYETAELLVKYGARTGNLQNSPGSIVHSTLIRLYGVRSTEKLLSTPLKRSQPLSHQQKPPLRHKRCFVGERQGFNESRIH